MAHSPSTLDAQDTLDLTNRIIPERRFTYRPIAFESFKDAIRKAEIKIHEYVFRNVLDIQEIRRFIEDDVFIDSPIDEFKQGQLPYFGIELIIKMIHEPTIAYAGRQLTLVNEVLLRHPPETYNHIDFIHDINITIYPLMTSTLRSYLAQCSTIQEANDFFEAYSDTSFPIHWEQIEYLESNFQDSELLHQLDLFIERCNSRQVPDEVIEYLLAPYAYTTNYYTLNGAIMTLPIRSIPFPFIRRCEGMLQQQETYFDTDFYDRNLNDLKSTSTDGFSLITDERKMSIKQLLSLHPELEDDFSTSDVLLHSSLARE